MGRLFGVVCLVSILLGYFGFALRTDGSWLTWLFNGLVNGFLRLVTLVLAIERLVLSEEFGTIDEISDRLGSMLESR